MEAGIEQLEQQDRDPTNKSTKKTAIPLWKANVAVFSFLFFVVVILFFYQMEAMKKTFLRDQMTHARILSSVFRLHLTNALESETITNSIVEKLLVNIGAFIDYLDAFEPFSPQELEGLSERLGLYGIAIILPDGRHTSGLKAWEEELPYSCDHRVSKTLFHDTKKHLFVLMLKRTFSKGCVICALASRDFEELQEKIGLSSVVSALREVKGVLSIEIKKKAISDIQIHPLLSSSKVLVEIPVEGKTLSVTLDATLYKDSLRRLWRNFIIISLLILGIGTALSYWLYRKQQAAMLKAIEFEKALARQREEAMIGRAAATIAHEVRNPLNAIHMGLQRVSMETDYLKEREKRLLDLCLKSVRRVNTIVSNLLEFARPLCPKFVPVDIKGLLEETLSLMDPQLKGIEIKRSYGEVPVILGDPDLLKQLFLNLIRNAVEAQPKGGFLEILIKKDDPGGLWVIMRNGGEVPKREVMDQILEPYFTTKTKGSGIGLPFSRRIANSMGGSLYVDCRNGVFEVKIFLPFNKEDSELEDTISG